MPETQQLQKHLPGILLAASLAIAAAFFLIWPPELQARTLFFPGTTAVDLSGERRFLPRVQDNSRQVYLVVEELILGPVQIDHGRLLPRTTEINTVAIRDTTVYVDLSPDILFPESEVRLDVESSLDGIRRTLLYNFRWIDDVQLTIGGQVPFYPAFTIPEDATG